MQIYMLLTENCNLNCSMCIRGKQVGENLNLKTLERIIKNNDFSSHDIVLTGGEPSLHGDLVAITKMMCSHARTVTITSNGRVGKYIQELIDCNNLFYQISLDGNKNKHDEIRGDGAFSEAWNTIEKLDSLNQKYSIAAVVSKKNKREIFDLFPIVSNLRGLRFFRISYEMPFGSAEDDLDNLMSADEWNEFVREAISKAEFRLNIQKIFPFDLYEKRKNEIIDSSRPRSLNCGSGSNKIYVYPDFKVYPCTCLTDFCVGDLNTQTFDEILSGEKNKRFSDYAIHDESVCNTCEYRELCNGGCIGMSYHFFGKLGMGDMRCPKLRGEK